MTSTCSIDGCSGKHLARGLCNKHYHKLKKYGDAGAGYEERSAKGSGNLRVDGYFRFHVDGKEMLAHVRIAERAIGKPLPAGAEVHHVDHDRSNNSPGNLVVCPSHAYHAVLHQRQRALDACGNANWRKCIRCHEYDDPANLYVSKHFHTTYHRSCEAAYQRTRRSKQK